MTKTNLLALFCAITLTISTKAQLIKDCPSYPAVNYFDSLCFNRIGDEEILLGQGRVRHPDLWGSFYRADVYVPTNRPLWAIAQVHGWQLIRNILKYEPYDKHMFAGTMMKESYLGCDGGISFAGLPAPFQYNITLTPNFQPGNDMNIRDGCFHVDKFTGTQGVLMKYYPHRFADLDLHHGNYIGGSNYERAIISKVMYDVILYRLREYSDGLDPKGVLGNAADPFAGEIYSALSYNKGFNDGRLITVLNNAARRATAIASGNWLTLNVGSGSFGYDYTNATSQVVRVLSNNNYSGNPVPSPDASFAASDNQWHNWYDRLYTWAEVESYLDIMLFMYAETNPTTVKNKVRAAFDKQKDVSNRVSFRYKFGPVLDAIVMALPYDDPMPIILSSTAGVDQCAGKIGPVVKITPTFPTTVCNGQSVQLSTIAGTGFSYQWKRNNVNVANSNPQQHIFFASQTGAYSVVVTTTSGAVIPSECSIDVTVENCSSCNMTATTIVSNNSCTGKNDGSATINLTNTGGQFPVTINWTGTTTGSISHSSNSFNMANLKEGTYQIEIVSNSNPTCKAFATARLNEAVKLNQSITINSTVTSCNSADLTAVVNNNPPSDCNYRLQLYENSGSPWWDHSIFRLDITANGTSLGPMRPRKKVWNDPVWLDTLFTISHNATINVTINNITTGNQIVGNFSLRLFHPNGSVAFTENLNSRSVPVNITNLRNLTANCQEAMPAYTFSWTPSTGLSSTNTLNTTSSVSSNTVYTLRANHPDPAKSGCYLSADVLVEETCSPLSNTEIKLFILNDQLNWQLDKRKGSEPFALMFSSDGISFSEKLVTFTNTMKVNEDGYYQIWQKEGQVFKKSNIVFFNSNELECLVFPNPSASSFNIKTNEHKSYQITAFDMTGKIVETSQQKGNHVFGKDWKTGIYLVLLNDENGNSKKIILIKN